MSEDTDFTKEQWAVSPTDLTVVEGIGISGRITWRICCVYGSSNRKRQQETTRFIAAAPETAAERDRLKAQNAVLIELNSKYAEMARQRILNG